MHPFHRKHNTNSLNSKSYSAGKNNGIKRDDYGEPCDDFRERYSEQYYYTQKDPQSYFQKESSTLTEKENILKSYILGNKAQSGVEQSDPSGEYAAVEKELEELGGSSSGSSRHPENSLNSERSTSRSPTQANVNPKVSTPNENEVSYSIHITKSNDQEQLLELPSRTTNLEVKSNFQPLYNYEPSIEEESTTFQEEEITPNDNKDVKTNVDEVENGIEKLITSELPEDQSQKSKASELGWDPSFTHDLFQKYLLASNRNVSNKWLGQGFVFDKSPATSYGLIQTKDGCSGIVAAVNAYVIKELLFREAKNELEYLRPNEHQLEPALVGALTHILWQAVDMKAFVPIYKKLIKEIKTIEDVINSSELKTVFSKNELENLLKDNIHQFTEPGGHGCILFLISLLLSHGKDKLSEDMNGGTSSLINSDGYCSMELVNLLLTGSAVPNVFDNHVRLQSSVIKGIPKRSDVGYLSIKEHFKCCKVGSYLKTPRFPIWLIHNEDQFTVLFSCQKQLLSDWKVERKFVMTHYDSKKRISDESRLSIDTTTANEESHTRDNLKVIVEHCVRTKWKEANITWT